MQIALLVIGVLIICITIIMYQADRELDQVRERTQDYLDKRQPDSK